MVKNLPSNADIRVRSPDWGNPRSLRSWSNCTRMLQLLSPRHTAINRGLQGNEDPAKPKFKKKKKLATTLSMRKEAPGTRANICDAQQGSERGSVQCPPPGVMGGPMTRGPRVPEHTPAARASLSKCPRPTRTIVVTLPAGARRLPLVPKGGSSPGSSWSSCLSWCCCSPQILLSGKHHSQLCGFGGLTPSLALGQVLRGSEPAAHLPPGKSGRFM